jgi:prepilin-type processing-associated H-X9-DG protein
MVSTRPQSAFVARDLVITLLMIALLILVALPSAANNRNGGAAARCVNNMRHLAIAWQLYASDNSERLVHNLHGGDAIGGAGADRYAPWASGWLTWSTETDNTNVLFLQEQRYARLAPYLRVSENVHKCPSDVYLSASQRRRGWKERVRTAVMNASVGHVAFQSNPGPWNFDFKVALKMSDLATPGPGSTMVFLEEHPDSVNDPLFFPPSSTGWIDVPSNLHAGGSSLTFGDGHVELHAWQGPTRSAPVSLMFRAPNVRPDDPDLRWVKLRTNRKF